MSLYLKGGLGSWSDVPLDADATACVLIIANAAGRRYCLGTTDVVVAEKGAAAPLHFVDAILNDPVHVESYDPFSKQSSVQSMKFEVMAEHLPLREIRKVGVLLQDIDVDVYWHVLKHGFSLDQALHLLHGKMIEPMYDEERGISHFQVEDFRLKGETPFPPIVATQSLISTLSSEEAGKPYPVVVGQIKKLPILDVDLVNHDDWLVMYDLLNEWSTPNQVSQVFDGDTPLAGPLTENQVADADGNLYVKVTDGGGGSSSRDVTAGVLGHSPFTVAETIRYLLRFFGSETDLFDLSSLDRIETAMAAISIGAAFNVRETEGVVGLIRSRLASVLPIAMVQQGGKYQFLPFEWDRDVVKHLRTGCNILRKTGFPAETRRSDIFNNFSIRYLRSGLRGDHTQCVVATKLNNFDCGVSVKRYGETPPMDVDAGDITNRNGANWLMTHLVETFSKVRVFVGYRCTLDAVNVRLLDTVMVTDEGEEWTDVLFKVIGIRRGTGPWVDLDLVSVDDYTKVYDVNKVFAAPAVSIPIDLEECWWEFGAAPNDSIDSQGDYGDDFDPGSGDFSTMMLVEEINVQTNQVHGLMGKAVFGLGSPGGWDVQYYGEVAGGFPGAVTFEVGKFNSLGTMVRVHTPGPMAVGRKVLIACMYTWAGDGTSIQRVVTYDAVNGKLFAQRVDAEAVGNNALDLIMGACQRRLNSCVNMYWSGFYKGTVLTDQDVLDVWNGSKHPINDFNPTVLNYFCQDVAATYNADVANGPTAPYVFDVIGTPVKGP